jgi:hypothetical protein
MLLRLWVQQRLLQHRSRRQQLLWWLLLLQASCSPGRRRVPAASQLLLLLLLHVVWCGAAEVSAEAVDGARFSGRGQGTWGSLPAGAQE